MKVSLFCLLLITSITVTAQKKDSLTHPYVLITGGIFKFDKQDIIPQGGLSVGATFNVISVGFGGKYTKFKDDKNSYIPIYAELIVSTPTVVAPMLLFRGGYGIYDNKVTAGRIITETEGGLYLEGQIGIAFGKGPHQFVLSGGYTRTSFKTTVGATKSSSDIGGISANLSIKI